MDNIPLHVCTICLRTGQTKERTINHANKKSRIWLGKHAFWAFRNGHAVLTGPAPFTRDAIAMALVKPMEAHKAAIDYAPADDLDVIE